MLPGIFNRIPTPFKWRKLTVQGTRRGPLFHPGSRKKLLVWYINVNQGRPSKAKEKKADILRRASIIVFPPDKMNEAHWNGSRVYFFDRSNKTIYGTVVDSTTREGTRLLIIRTEAGESISLPAAGVTLVSNGSTPQ